MIGRIQPTYPLIAQADEAMARGDVRQAQSLLELAAQRGRDASTLMRLATVRRSAGDLPGAVKQKGAGYAVRAGRSLRGADENFRIVSRGRPPAQIIGR